MVNCPHCHQENKISEEHHGTLFTCPLCQGVYFVGWDGLPEQQDPVDPALVEPFTFPHARPPVESEPPAETENPSSFEPLGMDANIPATDFSLEPIVSTTDAPNMQEVVDFANSNEVESALTYSVCIRGIDIADTREKVREALSDQRFGWDVDNLFKQIKNGQLVLNQMNPAKTQALISRIKFLDIEIEWRQDVFSL